MTTLKCGCEITSNIRDFEKEVRNENGFIERISYYNRNYITVCGNGRSKAILNIEKQQFKLICEESVNEPDNEPDTDI